MIKIIAGRGCYGHHLMNLLAVGTNLTQLTDFLPLSPMGDSHATRNISDLVNQINLVRFKHLASPPLLGEKFIVVIPSRDHILDYIDNSFSKESDYQFKDWFQDKLIKRDFVPEQYFSDLIQFLTDNHVWTADSRTLVPENKSWMIREFLSYKIDRIMFTSYERNFMLSYHSSIKTTDFFDNFESALTNLVQSLGLEFKLSWADIVKQNQTFVQRQQFHGIQKLCDQFVESTINKTYMENPCISIFDEAYVQSKLRNAGWEIKIDNLFKLPDSVELAKIIYPANLKGS